MSQRKPKKNTSLYSTLNERVVQIKNKRKAEIQKSSGKIKQTKIDRQNDIDYKESKLKADILKFKEDGFIVIEQDDIECTVQEISVSEGGNFRRNWKNDPLRVFFSVNSISMFSELCNSINDEMIKVITTDDVAEGSQKNYKKVTVLQLLQFMGLYILTENKYSKITNTDFKKNFSKVKSEEDLEVMGFNRFSAIKSCIKPSNESFDILVEAWVNCSKKHWTPGSVVAIDETIFAYKVRKEVRVEFENKKDPIPIHYIPRKPHPNGLLAWVLATKSDHTNKPYVLDMIPHYRYFLSKYFEFYNFFCITISFKKIN